MELVERIERILHRAYLARMPLVVKQNKSMNPSDIRALGAQRKMLQSRTIADLIEQTPFGLYLGIELRHSIPQGIAV